MNRSAPVGWIDNDSLITWEDGFVSFRRPKKEQSLYVKKSHQQKNRFANLVSGKVVLWAEEAKINPEFIQYGEFYTIMLKIADIKHL